MTHYYLLIRPTEEEIEMHARTLATASFLAVALSTGALLALAQTTKPAEPGTTSGKAKDVRDANKDGVITTQERAAARDQAAKRFKDADKNKDGGLSREEARAGQFTNIEKYFDSMDTNKDGKVTPEERSAWAKANRKATTGSSAPARSAPASKPSEGGLLPPR
jgi:hypothetical protein